MKRALSFIFIASLAVSLHAQTNSVILQQRAGATGKREVIVKAEAGKAIGFDPETLKLTTVDARGVAGIDYIAVTGTPTEGMVPVATDSTHASWQLPTSTSLHVFNVQAYGALGNGTHNDRTNINDAIAAAWTAGGGVVYFPTGHYKVSGSTWNATTNSLITVPQNNTYTGGAIPQIIMRGEVRGSMGATIDTYEGGVVIDASAATGATGTYPSVISAAGYQEITDFVLEGAKWNRIDFSVEDMTVVTPANPTFGGINLHNAMQGAIGDNVIVMASGATTQPTHTGAVGVILPAHLNNVGNVGVGRNVSIYGFYDGLWSGEHAVLQRPYIAYCVNGIRVRQMAHPMTGDVAIENCNYMLLVDDDANNCPLRLTVQGELNYPGAWNDGAGSGAFVYDVGNKLRGRITFELLSTLVGGFVTDLTYSEQVGGSGVVFENLMADAGGTPPAAPDLTSGLLSRYNLEDTSDASGNSHTLTNVGSTTFVAGKVNNAANFNGSSQLLKSAGTTVGASAIDFSVTGWFYANSDGSIGVIVGQGGTSGDNIFNLYVTGGDLVFSPTASPFATASTPYTTGAWHFFAITWNTTTHTGRLKLDAASWVSVTESAAMPNTGVTTAPFSIGGGFTGASGTSPSFWFDGKIDQVRVYNRILSDAEVAALRNGGTGI